VQLCNRALKAFGLSFYAFMKRCFRVNNLFRPPFAIITLPNTISSLEKIHRFLLNFGALSPNLFLDFPARQFREIILKKSSKNTQNALIEWLWQESTRYFTKIEVCVVSLVLSLVFKTVFKIFLAPLVCL
jgi:hypothetical protein